MLEASLIAICGAALGAFGGYATNQYIRRRKHDDTALRSEKIINDAKQEAQHLVLQAKEKSLKIIEEAKSEEKTLRAEFQNEKVRLEKREALFDQKLLELQNKAQELNGKALRVEEIKREIEAAKQNVVTELERVAGLPREEALNQLMARVEVDYRDAIASRIRKLESVADEEFENKARNIISLAVMRFAASQAVETTTTTIHLPSDDVKGRIIGKEGRNIKALELITGVEIIVDDTPGVITISGFSPIRRQIAKRSLDKLLKDGRIHPGRIEEAVDESKKDLAIEMQKAGEDALYQLGIPVSSIDPKLIQILGRLKFRTSYGQNALQHSIEVAHLSAMMAEELGADVFICKKGGLFHDIGKAVDHDMQGSHPEIGVNIMRKFGFPEEICYQSIGHHEDKPKTIEAVIVKAADAISGARPGARKASLEQYIQRLEELENVAARQQGVEKAYAIQAGREIRVFVHPKVVDDFAAVSLAKDIASQIEAELQYPGEIKVTIIRETRVIEYAR